jgi:hypothetical protein
MTPAQDLNKHSVEAPNLPYLENVINTSKSLLLEKHHVVSMLFLLVDEQVNIVGIPPSAMENKDQLAGVIRDIVSKIKPSSLCLLNDSYYYEAKEGESLDNIVTDDGVINKPVSEKSEALIYAVTEFENEAPTNRYMGIMKYRRDHNDVPNQIDDIKWFKNGQNGFDSAGRFVI